MPAAHMMPVLGCTQWEISAKPPLLPAVRCVLSPHPHHHALPLVSTLGAFCRLCCAHGSLLPAQTWQQPLIDSGMQWGNVCTFGGAGQHSTDPTHEVGVLSGTQRSVLEGRRALCSLTKENFPLRLPGAVIFWCMEERRNKPGGRGACPGTPPAQPSTASHVCPSHPLPCKASSRTQDSRKHPAQSRQLLGHPRVLMPPALGALPC